MKIKILFVLLYLVCICLSQNTLLLKFTKRHYVNPDSVKKVIEVTSSISNQLLTLYIENVAKNDIKQCTPKNNDASVFYCFISSIGKYNFIYLHNSQNNTYAQSIFVVSSYIDLFTITASRDSNCYIHEESISYTVKVKTPYLNSIDLNNIQIFAYSPKSIIKQINSTETINFTSVVDNQIQQANFTINGTHTRNQYIVRITENEDYEDTLGNINSFSFTKVTINDNFFFPSLGKIRFYSDFCNFEPDFLILKTENKQDTFILNCEPLKCYFSKYCYCYFDKKIVTKYGKMELFYNETSLKKYILSIKPLSQISLNTSTSKNSNYKEVTFEIIDIMMINLL